MSDSRRFVPQVFDPDSEVGISEHSRPHWSQAGTITFITMRLFDSLPREVIERWNRERLEFLTRLGVDCLGNWKSGRLQLNAQDRDAFDKQFNRLRETTIDRCWGQCELRNPEAAKIVSDSLLHFDNDRYLMGDFVIMPNHLHALVAFRSEAEMTNQCTSWMRFTATKINQLLSRKGVFWQPEPFDHLVRSEDQLRYLRGYISENPKKANLRAGEYVYRRSSRCF